MEGPAWIDENVLADLANLAEQADTHPAWPDASWRLVGRAGALAWSIPESLGGEGAPRGRLLEGSEQLASACLTSAFILSQREAAVRWLLRGGDALRQRYLPPMARAEAFATVGLSQLTTSRQHTPGSLLARPTGNGYRLDGSIPWVTGADQAAIIVAGATVEDGQQLIVVLPMQQSGVRVDAPFPLSALVGSRTARVHCEGAQVPADHVLAGPGEKLVRTPGGLETSCLAVGLTRAAVAFLEEQAQHRLEIRPAVDRLATALREARQRMHALARIEATAEDVLALRVRSTGLALRTTQAALAVARGSGFVPPHPVQRWIRQATFFLVWSCPGPVAQGLLDELAGLTAG